MPHSGERQHVLHRPAQGCASSKPPALAEWTTRKRTIGRSPNFSREPTIDTRQSPGLDLDALYSYGQSINQGETVGAFGGHGGKHAWDNASELPR